MKRFHGLPLLAFLIIILAFGSPQLEAQGLSTARIWNEMVLNAVRNDYARPTVHARNLFHTSVAMYDAFAAYDDVNTPFFLGKTTGDYFCPFDGVPTPDNVTMAREMAMSYAVYRIIEHRFENSPGADDIFHNTNIVFNAFGYDASYTDTNYSNGNPAALGNYIAASIIEFGMQDGANEANDYENLYYSTVNPPMDPNLPFFDPGFGYGNERLNNPNRWQPLDIPGFIDQAGNPIEGGNLDFLSPEWGRVVPFALTEEDLTIRSRGGNDYMLYHDPGPPCYLDTLNGGGLSEEYKWGFSMVLGWSSLLDTLNSPLIDISPASLGNSLPFPLTIEAYRDLYDYDNGGDKSIGYSTNPKTGMPYIPQFVRTGDYGRVLAEYWADGPNSETPPGHWFTILNMVNDHPLLEKKYKGEGFEMSDLEWDVKSYLAMGGAMHDSAISAWGNKGYYDYIRPISAIRYMVDKGQSTDMSRDNYSPNGIPLIPGKVEIIESDDPIAYSYEIDDLTVTNIGRIKYFIRQINDFDVWQEARYWRPYQSPSFVTPPFAGYVSGHSTFSRAAAEVLTNFTGDRFFPGGMGEIHIEKDNFLEFDVGPSTDMTLQWATYRDAADQSGLSRIWGGIHPPVDDIPGRKMGETIGITAFNLADFLFGEPEMVGIQEVAQNNDAIRIYPNPVQSGGNVYVSFEQNINENVQLEIYDNQQKLVHVMDCGTVGSQLKIDMKDQSLSSGLYVLHLSGKGLNASQKILVLE